MVAYDVGGDGSWVNVRVYGQPKLTSIVQPSGDTITIGSNGIYHQNKSLNTTHTVWFDRDGANRITAIHDPTGGSNGMPVVQYIYNNDTGNLIQVLKLTDRVAGVYATNQYHYDLSQFPHYITEIDNGLGVPITRNYYDSTGRLVATVDPNGYTNQFIHNLTNNIELVVDRLGRTNTFVYDSRGNVTAMTNAVKGITLSGYDANNNKTNEIVYSNNSPYATNSFTYDQNTGLLLTSKNPLGFTTTFAYNQLGELTNTVDARSYSSSSFYDSNTGLLLGTSDALGNTTTNFYDDNGLLMGSRDSAGTLTTNWYDGLGNLTNTATYTLNPLTILSTNSFGYDMDGNRTNSIVWRHAGSYWSNAVSTFMYDGQNRVIQTIDPDGGTNMVVFDAAGRQQRTVDKLYHTNTFAYDYLGRLVLSTFPDGSTNATIYDANGNRTSSIDQSGHQTLFSYDGLNRLTNTVFADSTTSSTIYDDLGRVKFSIDARGTTNAFGYDAAGRRIAVTNAWGFPGIQMTNGFVFDQNGNQTSIIDGAGHTTTYSFDALNRQVQVQYADTTKTFTGYDSAGRRIAETNQDGIATRFGYDGVGRLTFVTNAFGVTGQQVYTQFQYDEAGNETAQIDALGHTTLYSYDSMGRRVKRTMPMGSQSEGFLYDLVGNILQHTNFNGKIITNRFDSLNRLVARIYPDGTSNTFTFSSTGRRLIMKDASGSYTNQYDIRDRLRTNTSPAGVLCYSYDANGNVASIVSSNTAGTFVSYQYDPLNRLTNVADGRLTGTQNTAYGYDAAGNLKWLQYPNTVTNAYTYDLLNRLTNLLWIKNVTTTSAVFGYQLGAAGNRTNLNETVNSVPRGYFWRNDALYRLTNETVSGTSPTGSPAYVYDAAGNRSSRTAALGLSAQSLTYNSNDWLTSTDQYDSDGNTTLNGNSQPYSYDFEDHLTNFNNQVTLVYNAEGQRVKKVASGVTTLYLVDALNPSGYPQVLEELTVSTTTNVSCAYTYGLALISQRQPSITTNFYGFDGHGSVRFLTDPVGAIGNTYMYDAFGNVVNSTGTTVNNYQYAGEQWDPNLGFYYLRARYYKPDSGRFWTLDTFEGRQDDPQSLHKYIYCSADPVNKVDPSGNDELLAEDFGATQEFAIEARSVTGIAGSGANAISRVVQSAALFGFLADQFGLFDGNPQSQIETLKKNNPNDMIFLHATSTGGWPELAQGGIPQIDPSRGFGKDFGRGFYTFNASSADPRVVPSAIEWANRTAGKDGGIPEVTVWRISRSKYGSLTKADFSQLSAMQYSEVVGNFRDKKTQTTGSQVAFGEIAKQQGGAWVRDFSLPFQYKFEGRSGIKDLRFSGGFSQGPLH
jgi:RHS repeat-associated protein